MPKALIAALQNERAQVKAIMNDAPDWKAASTAFDALFRKMADPHNADWPKAFIDSLHATYLHARENDKECANVTVRTVKAMPVASRNDTKKVLLEIASVCRIFNAAHKVNFDAAELPKGFDAIPMAPSTKKGVFTYAEPIASLYPKTSLTVDYWIPKILDWTQDLRAQRINSWRNGDATALDSCTDFMNICLAFLADPGRNVPIAKAEDREALLDALGEPFIWKKKSAKREDVAANSALLKSGLASVGKAAGMAIPIEAWSRLQHAPFIKPLLK